MSTPLTILLDDDDPMLGAYRDIALPEGWSVVVGMRAKLSAMYNDAYQRSPGVDWWGFISDDVVPETDGWDRALVSVAHNFGMAVPEGGHDPDGAPHFVISGRLVDEMGWLALPGLDRLFIDTVWLDIAKQRGLLRRVPGVVLRHHHFSNNMALRDNIYRKRRKKEDRRIYETWRNGRKTK